MNVIIKQASLEEKPILKKLMKPYLKELGQFFQGDIYAEEYKYLDLYWIEPERIPYLVYFGNEPVGFVLVNSYIRISENNGARAISEFFIIEEFRNQGLGNQAATEIFRKFPGKWEVAVAKENTPALNFWEKTINEYTLGNFQKVDLNNEIWRGPIYSFSS